MKIGHEMYSWAKALFPIFRSITGPGVRQTLLYIKNILPSLQICEVPSGSKVFDWVVPDEWIIKTAYIADEEGNIIVDFKKNNLHVMGYSAAVDAWVSLDELNVHLHSLPNNPDAIPYVTSYYKSEWGFCITQSQRDNLKDCRYHVCIESELKPGVLNYAEIIYKGIEDKEIFISTYICHPSLANNEISGPVVTTALARYVSAMTDRRYTYRFIYIPETIGSITYLSRNYLNLKKNVVSGFNITCVGDDLGYSFMPSINGDTLADDVALYVLNSKGVKYKEYSFLDRGSDERQYCWPGINLPIASIMRSKYGTYPQYHTSQDDLTFISASGLHGAFELYKECIDTLEANFTYNVSTLCEPNLGRRGLYPTVSTLERAPRSKELLNFMTYCDGERSMLDVAAILNLPISEIKSIVATLLEYELIKIKN